MKVLYDDNVFSWQKYGGISRYFCQLMINANSNYSWQLSVKYSDNEYLAHDHNLFQIDRPPLNRFFFEKWNFRGKNSVKKVINKFLKLGSLNFSEENREYSVSCLEDGAYDVFHPTYYDDYFLKHNKKPFVLTVHDMNHELFPEYFPNDQKTVKLKAKLMSEASHLIAISESTKKDMVSIAGIPESKISVIYHGSPFENLVIPDKQKQDNFIKGLALPKRYVLFTGNRTGYKNFSVVMEAMKELMAKDATLELVCTGSPFSDLENKLLSNYKIRSRIKNYAVSDEQLYCLYKNASCFVFPSLYEGFGFPVLEAFATGCPSILSNKSSLPEIGADAALYFEPNDPSALSNLIQNLINDESARSDLVEKGYIQYQKFSWKQTALLTAQVYKSL